MRLYFVLTLFLIGVTANSQEYFVKKYDLNSVLTGGFTIDTYDDDRYLIAGLKNNPDSTLYLFVGLLDSYGTILKLDSIPQDEFIISINQNNDTNLVENELAIYYSVGSGKTILYGYGKYNGLESLDTISTSELEFRTADFISYNQYEHLFVGLDDSLIDSRNLAFLKYDAGNVEKVTIRSDIAEDTANRIFTRTDGSIIVLTRHNPSQESSTYAVYHFDKELNLINEVIGDTEIARSEFTDAIMVDDEKLVIGCRLASNDNQGLKSGFRPMISFVDFENGSHWDRVIGRVVNNEGITAGWFGLTESVEADGYVAAGTMLINAPLDLDSLKTLGALVKLNTEGDSIWYREFSTIDTSYAFTTFRDVVATSDGYMIIGDEFCWSDYSGCDGRSNLLIVRTDSEGRIEPDSSTAVITIDEARIDLLVYPNPVAETLYVQHEIRKAASYKVIDMSGRVVKNFVVDESLTTMKVPVLDLKAGNYILSVSTTDGSTKREVQFIKG